MYQNLYVIFKKLLVFSGNHNIKIVCRRCLSFYSSQNVVLKHEQPCRHQEITSIRTSNESHINLKKHFHKNILHFSIYAVSEAANEIDFLI